MNMSKKYLATLVILVFSSAFLSAQNVSFGVHGGYANPQGDAFVDPITNEKQSSFGLGYDLDLLYIFESDERLKAGLAYCGNALFGKNSEGLLDLAIYGLRLYGVKGHYRLNEQEKAFSPYASLTIGLSQFSTPDVTFIDGVTQEETILEGESAFSFGVRPEIGINIKGFIMSVAYFVPMKYTLDSSTGDFNGTAGALNFSIGYRTQMDLW
jgi:hypothetical protein